MSDVTRYDVCQYEGDWAYMEPCSDGDWVHIENYQALEAENAKLRAELERRESGEWKLVPIEPTLEMLDAAKEQADCMGDWYRAMLAAAPSAPKDDPVKTMLLEALEHAVSEYEKLPHSLGYEFTHLPSMRAAIAAARKEGGKV